MKRNKAFTLVELLVVIAIIALLLSVLLPSLAKARASAKRVVCGAREKQVITAVIMAAQNNRGSVLPRGGIHGPDIGTPLDDQISLRVEDYFNIGSAFAWIPGGYTVPELNTNPSMIAEIDTKLNNAGFNKIFVCPEVAGKDKFTASAVGSCYNDKRILTYPFVHKLGNWWIVRLGYCYVGGYETNTNDEEIQPGDGIPWKSPKTLSDPGHLALITDRTRWIPGYMPWTGNGGTSYSFTASHGKSGYFAVSLRLGQDVRKTYPTAGTNIGTLDGAVQFRYIRNLQPHQMTWMPTGSPVGVDYNFF